jgi:hypothetical protein
LDVAIFQQVAEQDTGADGLRQKDKFLPGFFLTADAGKKLIEVM